LIFSGHVLGVLDVQSDQLDAFDMDDYFAFRALADTIAIALRNANLYRSERWRRQVADSMVQVASMLSSDSLLDEILDAILAELDRTLPCDLAAICLFRDEELSIAAVRGYHAGLTLGEFPADANLWLARAFSANGPLIRPDDSPPDPIAQALAFPDDYSAIAAPLRARGQLGLLYLAHNTSGRYGSESEVVMSAFASYAAVAIENARAYQTSQEQALISTVMLQVAKATQSLDTLDQVLQTIVRLTPMLVGLERCAILLWDESQERFLPTIAYGLNSDQQQIFENWQIDIDTLDPFDRLLLTRSPVVVHDVRTSSELPTNTLESLGFESFLALPLLAQGDILGAMLVDYRQSESGIDSIEQVREESLTIIQGIAHQAAAAIENAQLREAQQEEAYVSTALLQVAQTIASLTDIEDILSAIVRITPILVGVERCVLFLWNNRDRVFQATHAYGLTREMETALFAQRYEPGEFKLLDTIIQQDSPVEYEADGQHLDPGKLLAPEFSALIAIDQPAPRSLLGVPLSAKGDVLAVMLLEETSLTNRFRERRLEIITGITQQAALALQNEQLQQVRLERERMSRELQLAYEIQSTFIPDRLPTLAGWEFATVWRAAREVAGDFFDLIDLPNDKLGLMIADVADKGMPAALFMILTRTLVRAATLEELSPAKVLERVNELLVPDAKRGMFVTAFYAVLSSQDGQITWANAGHNLPLILHNNAHQIEQLPKGGMALGVSRRLELEEHTSTLAPGDFLVLYTDGVTEAQSPQGIMYEGQRLQQTVLQAQTQSAAAMLDAIDNAVRAHVDTAPASDDLTLIVARRLDNGE
jgi:serine phosphatase RsbU (regulator of sigma subunit)